MSEVISEKEVIEVQEDTQVDEKKWYVYCHTNKTNNKKYFGITSQEPHERWRQGRGYKTSIVFWRAIQKYGWDGFVHEIIDSGLTENMAKKKEVELISLYKTNCNKYQNPSYGYNLTDGGDGVSGIKPWNYGLPISDRQREIIRRAHLGKPLSKEHRKKLSDVKKGKTPSNLSMLHSEEAIKKNAEARRGKRHSEERKKNISNAKKGKYTGVDSSRFRPVYCTELNQVFWGAKEVENIYGFSSANIGACCRGQRNYAYRHPITNDKLHWLYAEDAIKQKYLTQEDLDNYLNNLKKETIDYDIMEEK